ncbi:cytochrome c oxidase subunit 6A1, mitochondrial [Drosophila ficusphila]|uniref:cytochrome c oxidase subunit 6A1, mitochondrial n=1 Tax=Drosophila ficusphila TaxID=30025 RepID=UPI0007E73148|nr:cytochrome c oxidase subunit 6A1, mitochondrial [Drosophila ficusphila]
MPTFDIRRMGMAPGNSAGLWKKVTFLLAVPAIVLCAVNAFTGHKHQEREPFAKYEYLRRRTKRFPWGDGNRSLFHNAEVNALPEGYEDEVQEEEE